MRSHRSILIVGSIALASCSDHGGARTGPTPQEWERPALPLRILPPRPTSDPEVTLEQALASDTEGWWTLSYEGSQLGFSPCADSSRASLVDGALAVERGSTTLIRFLDLPEGSPHEIIVDIEAPPETNAATVCDRVYVADLQDLSDGDDVAQILARRTIENGNRSTPLLLALSLHLRRTRERPQARWLTSPDDRGFARARHRVFAAPHRRMFAVFLPATDSPVRVRSMQIRTVPRFRAPTSAPHSSDGATSVKLSREIRPSVWIDAGESLDLAVRVPKDAARLTLALGMDPDAAFRATANYRLALTSDDGFTLASTDGSLVRQRGGSRFEPLELALVPTVTAATPSHFKVEVDGDTGLFVAQPILREALDLERADRETDVARPPNLLFISLDTLRADHLGSYGYDRDTSPFLDRVADRSTLFLNYFAVAPYTLPTHATMFTGRFPARHGAVMETDRLDTRTQPYLPLILANRGYATAAFTGGGFLSEVFGFPDGFDLFGTVDPIKPDREARDELPTWGTGLVEVKQWIGAQGRTPWFAFVHTFMIHDYEPPASDLAAFDTRPAVTAGRDHHAYLRGRTWMTEPPSAGDIEHCVNLYDATIRTTDRQLEALFADLEEHGQLDRTIVVVTSDHGEEFWEHGGLRHAVTLYDEMLRVPLWIMVPGRPGNVVREPMSQADLFPTLLDLLDIPSPGDEDGHSMAASILGSGSPEHRTPLYATIDNQLSSRAALRVGSRKLISNRIADPVSNPISNPISSPTPQDRDPARTTDELYDMEADPGESENLAADRPTWTARLQAQIEALETVLRRGSVESAAAEMTPEVRQHLIELGYLGG